MRQTQSRRPLRALAAGSLAAVLGFAVPQAFAADTSPTSADAQQVAQATPQNAPDTSRGTSPSTGQSTPPGATQPSPGSTQSSPSTAPTSPGTGAQTEGSTTSEPTVSKAEVVGKELRSANGESFGDIEGVVESGGKVSAVLVDVGGFLGLGSKRVAVPVSEISPQGDHVLAKGLTQEEVEKLPEHKGESAKKGGSMTK